MDKGIELMREAIVEQAIKDLEYGLKHKDKRDQYGNWKNHKAEKIYNDVIRFFESGWYDSLCGIDAQVLVDRVVEFRSQYKCSILRADETKKRAKRKVPLKYERIILNKSVKKCEKV